MSAAADVPTGLPLASSSGPPSPPLALPPLDPTVSPFLDRTGGAGSGGPMPGTAHGSGSHAADAGAPQAQARALTALTYQSAGSAHHAAAAAHEQAPVPRTNARAAAPPATASMPGEQYHHTGSLGIGAALAQAQLVSQQEQQRLAAVITESVEFARAADQLQALRARSEALTQQLLQAGRARDAAEGALLEQSQRMQVRRWRRAAGLLAVQATLHRQRGCLEASRLTPRARREAGVHAGARGDAARSGG
jgi:hypothetical protein